MNVMIDNRRKCNFDGLWGGVYSGAVVQGLAGGLPDVFGKISHNGEGTIINRSDLEKMHQIDFDNFPQLDMICQNIQLMKKKEPEQPIIVIVNNPASTAARMMERFFVQLIKDPDFIRELIQLVEKPIWRGVQYIIEAGVDIIWTPQPMLSATCISKKHYQNICRESTIKFNKKVKETGIRIIAHTCGNWNDRFDLAAEEYIDCIHVSEANLTELKESIGQKVSLMGQVPTGLLLNGNPEEVYDITLEQCIQAGKDGGFILSPDCDVPPDVSLENIEAMVNAVKDAEVILF